jgi:hypothetical protein
MKAIITNMTAPRRGAEPEVGNVYQNPHGRPWYKIIVGIVNDPSRIRAPYNNIVMLHIDARGEIVGSSNQPTAYVRDHHDLVGKVKEMPNLKIDWFREDEAARFVTKGET